MAWRESIQALTGDADRWEWPLSLAEYDADRDRFGINTARRVEYWLAQCAHESAGFKRLVESLNYSAERLVQVWPNRFTIESAREIAHDQRRIGERVYGGRLGNGPEGSGDGFSYRGRGLIQITGRANYAACGVALSLNLTLFPELLENPSHAARSAAWFWSDRGCNELADAGDFEAVTRRINGATIGMADRLAWLEKTQLALA
jgi:putative chitinase